MNPGTIGTGDLRPSARRLCRIPFGPIDLGNDASPAAVILALAHHAPLVIDSAIFTMTEQANVTATNEVQTVTEAGDPDGGTFTLTFGGQTTAAIAFDAAASVVEAALEALSTIGSGNVAVTRTGTTTNFVWTVTFQGDLAATNVAEMTADASLLTDAGSHVDETITIATTATGATAASQAGHLKLGIASETVALDDDAICDVAIDPTADVYSDNIIALGDMESTLKTSPEWNGHPIVPQGYSVVLTPVKHTKSGCNDGIVQGWLLAHERDNLHSDS